MLGPDGRPVPGAKLYRTLALGYSFPGTRTRRTSMRRPDRTAASSSCQPLAEFTTDNVKLRHERTVVAAAAPNYGVGWVEVPPGGRSDDLTIRLVEDRPITGQIIDLEGKPVPGVTLRVMEINAAAGEDLGPWLEAAKAKKGPQLLARAEVSHADHHRAGFKSPPMPRVVSG